MSSIEVKELREIIFDMLNFTNMYCLALDGEMNIKFVNKSLSMELGYESYKELLDKPWIDFVPENQKEIIKSIHHSVANGIENWEEKYREVHSSIISKNGKSTCVYWFNSHINSKFNWVFSFGIKKLKQFQMENIDSIREYYYELLNKDKVMINSMRDVMGLRNKIAETFKKTNFE